MFPHLYAELTARWADYECSTRVQVPGDLTFAREVSLLPFSPSKQKLKTENSTPNSSSQPVPCPARFLTKNTLVNYTSWSHRNRVQPHLCVPCSVLVVQQFPPSNTVPVTKT